MAKILIIDDDTLICAAMSKVIRRMGHDVASANTLKDGLEMASSLLSDVIYLDVRMPDGNGLDMLTDFRILDSTPEIIIMTGSGDPDGAELAIRSGAWDYIEKPTSVQEMTLPLIRALQYRNERSAAKIPKVLKQDGIIGKSPQMEACLDLLAQAADSDVNVLITGETGTGKEIFARAIHENSARVQKNFIVVDCAALPETLIESMLFGHEKGAFTGAEKAQDGLIRQADLGTLFLDEIGELPLSLQKAFLRVLQERRFRPIGSKREVTSRFRVVAATNRDLNEMVHHGQFRSDLLFRLQSFVIELPPLRERPQDIKELTLFYVASICERYSMGTKGFSPEFIQIVSSYPWPGNIRELVNTLERAVIAARQEPTLYPKHLPTQIRITHAKALLTKETATKDTQTDHKETWRENPVQSLPNLQHYRQIMEQQYLRELLAHTEGNIEQACTVSGLSRSRLYALLKKYNLLSEKKKQEGRI
jgi:two-component system NtrC family response regulator